MDKRGCCAGENCQMSPKGALLNFFEKMLPGPTAGDSRGLPLSVTWRYSGHLGNEWHRKENPVAMMQWITEYSCRLIVEIIMISSCLESH